MDVAKSFALQSTERTAQALRVVAHDMRPEVPVRARGVAFMADGFGQVEHDGDAQTMPSPRQLHQRLARFRLNIGGVDHR